MHCLLTIPNREPAPSLAGQRQAAGGGSCGHHECLAQGLTSMLHWRLWWWGRHLLHFPVLASQLVRRGQAAH